MFKVKMPNFKKNKKGVEAAWGAIIMIIAVIASAIVILWVLKSSASKVDEELQADLCRVSNELLVGTEEASPWYLHGYSPRVCSTIWRTDKDLQIPTAKYREKYENVKDAAEAEVMSLIAKCWYEWLEGSDPDVFPQEGIGPVGRWWGGSGCYICYGFKLSKDVEGFSFDSLQESMENTPYTAFDLSNKCAANGGFLKENKNWHCSPSVESGWKVVKSKEDEECCVRENAMDECGNKGGMCSESPSGIYINEYQKWSCPETNQKCYVTEESYLSYYGYITKRGARGGDLVTHYDGLNFKTDVIAISFHSYRDGSPITYIELSNLQYAKDMSDCEKD